MADRLVITKTDLISQETLAILKRDLLRLNPTAKLFDVNSDIFDAAGLLTEGVSDPETKLREVQHWLRIVGRSNARLIMDPAQIIVPSIPKI